ncbi:MAG: winged helix-turn-helix transcriptional regulator [Thermogemmatispora sp.]|uniref:winged helix-turn-helix domain-containing protein n=1 Tax=Thermogemmatispora sp. TaxID=1968838 RepID=UPI002617CF05|nr:winged helix-turn-helix domain-containing protein [Thermogemmatispora sp.]MBX5459269.1 winged helix-turn-helix transcriptional regulator [Thermogemmatispora sp.]
MARSRSIPVALLKEPDFFELSAEARVVFIGLILEADDEGRGRAHQGLLARLFNVSEAAVEEALRQLVERGLLLRYQVGRQQYYQWLTWRQWQSLSKPTPSQLPPPPAWGADEAEGAQASTSAAPGFSGASSGNPGKPGKARSEEEEEGEGEEEEKEKEKEKESLVTKQPAAVVSTTALPKIVPFPGPTSPPADSAAADKISLQEIADILGLPCSRQLCQVLEEFASMGWSALRGEAIECAEYARDPRRNQRQQRLTPGFFRRWLKRAAAPPRAALEAAAPERQSSAGDRSSGTASPRRRDRVPEPVWSADPMAQYRAYVGAYLEAQRRQWEATWAEEQAAGSRCAQGGS